MPPRSVAAQLDLPVETVRTRTRRACELLRTKLDRRYGDRSTWAGLALELLPRPGGTPPVHAEPGASTGSSTGARPELAATGPRRRSDFSRFAPWSGRRLGSISSRPL